MDAGEFQDWLGGIGRLSTTQPRQAFQELALFEASNSLGGAVNQCSKENAATVASEPAPVCSRPLPQVGVDTLAGIAHRRVESMGCPHCNSHEVAPWGSASAMPRYRCKNCKRTFNGLTKTPLARPRQKDKWLEQAKAMIDGVSVAKTAERCNVHHTTAFRWRHRFLTSPALDKPHTLSGIVESDEMFILGSSRKKVEVEAARVRCNTLCRSDFLHFGHPGNVTRFQA